jgi:hypothetical protein
VGGRLYPTITTFFASPRLVNATFHISSAFSEIDLLEIGGIIKGSSTKFVGG